ncbi:MAG: DUF4238 domain-containing protein [Chlorobiales bacterium]|nr:DUF4238 domain-containing protein [Chlorobiales bacterium]
MSTARRHHYIPQSYLAAFTDTGTKDGQFWVMEVKSGDCFFTSPKNVGVARDFNRIDVDGQAIDALESVLASFEGKAVEAIRKVLKKQTFPSAKESNVILNFVCLLAVRNPQSRKTVNKAKEQVRHILGEILVSDPRTFEHHMSKAEEAGYISNTNASYEEMKKFVEERRYRPEFHPQDNSRSEFKIFDKLLPILGKRTWSLFLTPENGPEFICSDHPVTLVWKGGRSGPIGFGLRQTEVFIPLGRKVGLYGTFEDPLLPEVNLRAEAVAALNTRTEAGAERHVFSCLKTFNVIHEGHIREVVCDSPKRPSGPFDTLKA